MFSQTGGRKHTDCMARLRRAAAFFIQQLTTRGMASIH
jgi:hypothetical protein